MTVERIERATANFASILHIKITVVGLNVRETGKPFFLLHAPELAVFDLGLATLNVIRKRLGRSDHGVRSGHDTSQQFITQAWRCTRPTLAFDPL